MQTKVDEWCCLQCGDCQYFKVNADLDNVESTCKRLDHKHLKFAVPWFKSYDCGKFSGLVCRDFTPKPSCKWLYDHWTDFDSWVEEIPNKQKVSLVIDGNTAVRYKVRFIDFINNTFLTSEGEVKWVEKEYYKISRSSLISYVLIHEKNPCFGGIHFRRYRGRGDNK